MIRAARRAPRRVAVVAATVMGCILVTAAGIMAAAVVATRPPGSNAPAGRTMAPAPAPDRLALGFTPPEAGTYQLERILRAPDGPVLDSDGSAHPLRAYTTGRITLFSFIYTYCTDAKGCPLAYATLHAVRAAAAADAALWGKVRLVSMSFDPVNDTPAMMRSYGGDDARRDAPIPWYFLTTASAEALAPLLAGFGQDVAVVAPGQAGARVALRSHLLKVYLIDDAGTVREIYATAYLHPRILLNDIRTLLAEEKWRRPSVVLD